MEIDQVLNELKNYQEVFNNLYISMGDFNGDLFKNVTSILEECDDLYNSGVNSLQNNLEELYEKLGTINNKINIEKSDSNA